MACKITVVITPRNHSKNHFTECLPEGTFFLKKGGIYIFNSDMKHVFAQHNFCDSWMLWLCKVYSQPRHRMRVNQNECVQLQTQLNIQRYIQRP